MRRILSTMLASAAVAVASAQSTSVSQMERLDRGLVALPASSGTGNFVSWRLLGTDDEDNTRFELLRNGQKVTSNLYVTNYNDTYGTSSSRYQVVTIVDGERVDTTDVVTPWGQPYKTLTLDRPAGGTLDDAEYTYSPNDCSVGDVDGDGQYELFVKWDPSNAKDNSQSGTTGNVYIDCYRLDGTKLWRIDLGRNIRAGAHYTQFMVYDFDRDGKAEMICKTAPGSKDGQGKYVNQAATDAAIRAASNTKSWVVSGGRINGGQEYLTVFSGATGEALHTIAYYPTRNAVAELSEAEGTYNWDTRSGKSDKGNYGNRGERYLAAVAYLDGPDKPASGIFSRGYYTYAHIYAVTFDGKHLNKRWLHSSETASSYKLTTYDAAGTPSVRNFSGLKPTSGSGSGTMFGNGNHNMSVADVDGDGCDEIIWGSGAVNNDGTLLYGTGFGHGDAIHLADHNPYNPGLEVFQVHEEKGTYAWDLHDARTGAILLKGGPEGIDNGRGMAGQFDASVRGSLLWSGDKVARRATDGSQYSEKYGSMNFRIYWDGDLQEELFDGGKIDKWNGNGTSRVYLNSKNLYDYNHSSTCNGTKSTPNLQADMLGDWREEVILWSSEDAATLNIFTTNTTTKYRMPTLMHDHTYRMGICWQNTAYNQPPHLGYYLPDAMLPMLVNNEKELTVAVGDTMVYSTGCRYTGSLSFTGTLLPDGTKKSYGVPDGFKRTMSYTAKTALIEGRPQAAGDYKFCFKLTGLGGEVVNDTVTLHVTDPLPTGITAVHGENDGAFSAYDLSGRRMPATAVEQLGRGLYIVRKGGRSYKVSR